MVQVWLTIMQKVADIRSNDSASIIISMRLLAVTVRLWFVMTLQYRESTYWQYLPSEYETIMKS